MANLRYHIRENPRDPYWSMVDIFTGQPAVVHGVTLDLMTAEEADDWSIS